MQKDLHVFWAKRYALNVCIVEGAVEIFLWRIKGFYMGFCCFLKAK